MEMDPTKTDAILAAEAEEGSARMAAVEVLPKEEEYWAAFNDKATTFYRTEEEAKSVLPPRIKARKFTNVPDVHRYMATGWYFSSETQKMERDVLVVPPRSRYSSEPTNGDARLHVVFIIEASKEDEASAPALRAKAKFILDGNDPLGAQFSLQTYGLSDPKAVTAAMYFSALCDILNVAYGPEGEEEKGGLITKWHHMIITAPPLNLVKRLYKSGAMYPFEAEFKKRLHSSSFRVTILESRISSAYFSYEGQEKK